MSGVRDIYQQECSNLAQDIDRNEKNDPLIEIVRKAKERKKHGLIKYLDPKYTKNMEETDREHYKGLKEMEIHGDYFKQLKKNAKHRPR